MITSWAVNHETGWRDVRQNLVKAFKQDFVIIYHENSKKKRL